MDEIELQNEEYNTEIRGSRIREHRHSSKRNSFAAEINDYFKQLRINYRLLRKQIKSYINARGNKNFINIVYLTAGDSFYVPDNRVINSPVEFINDIRKQYPDINVCLLVPIIGLGKETKIGKKMTLDFENKFFNIERTSVNFEFFAGNEIRKGLLYKFDNNESNIQTYGIYSPAFSYLKSPEQIKSFSKLVLFMKAARTAIKLLHKEGFKPDIVHSEVLPFYMASEFEQKMPNDIKVLQVFDDFTKLESLKQEPFWSFVNIAGEYEVQRLCKDTYIQNCISRLFNIPIKNVKSKMHECINFICQNYSMFQNSNENGYMNKGDVIFRHLNDRTKKLFPNFIQNGDYYNPYITTLTNCDFWAVYSKSYYKELFKDRIASPLVMDKLLKTEYKSDYIEPALCMDEYSDNHYGLLYKEFDEKNYKSERAKNKKTIIKEFSSDYIKTNFTDKTIFKNPDMVKIYGYLDSFYDAPLLFANPEPDIFAEGTDILFGTIFKLFERNRNIQIILSIKDGLKNNHIKSAVDFLNENRINMGKWVYIDDEVNLAKVFSASDLFLYPARICTGDIKHLLSLKYGCVPVVAKTGILNDGVVDIYDDIVNGNGFKTRQSLLKEDENTNVYINCLEKALELYNRNSAGWNIITKNCITADTGWSFEKLERYNKIYQKIYFGADNTDNVE